MLISRHDRDAGITSWLSQLLVIGLIGW